MIDSHSVQVSYVESLVDTTESELTVRGTGRGRRLERHAKDLAAYQAVFKGRVHDRGYGTAAVGSPYVHGQNATKELVEMWTHLQ